MLNDEVESLVLDNGRHYDKRDTQEDATGGNSFMAYGDYYDDTFFDQEGGRHSDYANTQLELQSLVLGA